MCDYRTDGLSHFSNGVCLLVRGFGNTARITWNYTKE